MKYRRFSSNFHAALCLFGVCLFLLMALLIVVYSLCTKNLLGLILLPFPLGFASFFLFSGNLLIKFVELDEDKVVFRSFLGKETKAVCIDEIPTMHIEDEHIGHGSVIRYYIFDLPQERKTAEAPFKLAYNKKNKAIVDKLLAGRVPFTAPVLLARSPLLEGDKPAPKVMYENALSYGEETHFKEIDGWLFAILLTMERNLFSIRYIYALDKYFENKFPSLEEINASLSRLESEGFFAVSGGRVAITKRGKLFYKKHGKIYESPIKMQSRYAKLFADMELSRRVVIKEYFTAEQYESVRQA